MTVMPQRAYIWNRDLIPDRWRPVAEICNLLMSLFWIGLIVYCIVTWAADPSSFSRYSLVWLALFAIFAWACWPRHVIWRGKRGAA